MPYDLGMPYRDGNPLVYDSGDFAASPRVCPHRQRLRRLSPRAGRAARQRGIHRGIGISGYAEGTAIGPYEGATIKLDASGRVLVATGAVNSGQGHETSFAQVAADVLGVPLDWVTVIGGDTAAVPFGTGTYASRSAVTAGSSIVDAARQVRDKLARAAAALLEAAPADIEIEDGRAFVRGAPGSAIDLARVIQAAMPTFAKPGVASPDFEATAYHHVPTVTWASAVHVAVVEVDTGTGHVKLLRYVVAHDCGKIINPTIVEGQVHGGVAQGVGGALFEEIVYDEQGQLLTGTLLDYLVPSAMELPAIETVHLEYPSPRNPLGIKGLGEGGAISPPAAIANAIDDALAPFRHPGAGDTRQPGASARFARDVKPAPFEYFDPRELDEALERIESFGDEAKVLAGGQSLMPMLNLRLARPAAIIDINRLPGLDTFTAADGHLAPGCARSPAESRALGVEPPSPSGRCLAAGRTLGHPQPGHRGREHRPRRPRLRAAGPAPLPRWDRRRAKSRRDAADCGGGFLPGAPDDSASKRRAGHGDALAPARSRHGLGVPRGRPDVTVTSPWSAPSP